MCTFSCEARRRSDLKIHSRNSCDAKKDGDLEELEPLPSETVLPAEYNVPAEPISQARANKLK